MKIYSVTEVLGKYVDWGKIPADILAAACARGSETHTGSELYAKFGYPGPLSAGVKGYVQSFINWFDLNVEKVLIVEQRFECPDYLFTGRPDFLFLLRTGEIALTDIKTPVSESATWKCQLAAYDHLIKKNTKYKKIDALLSLRLRADGSPARGQRYETGRDVYFSYFLAALTAHRGILS
jgi:hypothetical protein